jgi:hypothetical protein
MRTKLKLTALVVGLSSLTLSGCEPPPQPTNQAGLGSYSTYLTTVENCDIYSVHIDRQGTVYLSKCRDTFDSAVSWDEPVGKGRISVGNATYIQTVTKEQQAAELKQQALSKLTIEEKTLLGLTK